MMQIIKLHIHLLDFLSLKVYYFHFKYRHNNVDTQFAIITIPMQQKLVMRRTKLTLTYRDKNIK